MTCGPKNSLPKFQASIIIKSARIKTRAEMGYNVNHSPSYTSQPQSRFEQFYLEFVVENFVAALETKNHRLYPEVRGAPRLQTHPSVSEIYQKPRDRIQEIHKSQILIHYINWKFYPINNFSKEEKVENSNVNSQIFFSLEKIKSGLNVSSFS